MADLIRTDDADAEDEEQEEAGLVLSKRSGLRFGDLVSDDEEPQEEGGWTFDGHNTVDDEPEEIEAPVPEYEGEEEAVSSGPTSLLTKIKARLRERAAEGESVPDPVAEDEQEAATSSTGSKFQAPQGATRGSHLETGMHFAELRLSRPLLRAVKDLKFESPTPIQRDVIPPALKGLDILATAETGSGKTASFLLPILERLCQSASVRSRKRDAGGRLIIGPVATKAMIMIPTRELAVQCHAMLKDLAKYTPVTFQLVAGGYVAQDQERSLRQQPDIVVATPGRLLDHLLNSQSVHMELLEIVIFDEADRLLEMGFRNECLEVLKRCSKGRQTMLFSATLNASVEDLAGLALVKPIRVHANPPNKVAETLEQEFVKAPSEEFREAVVLSLCTRNYKHGVIIFCNKKQAAHRLAIIFGLCGLRFAEIHGNLPQGERVHALQRFQQKQADFLMATDLASRGLDLCNVETVINFNIPVDSSRYIHRVGRTARMGRTGRAVTVYAPEEYGKVKKLGRECCSKVKSKVLKRTVAADAIKLWAEKIKSFEEDINAINEEESVERELRLADILTTKTDNIVKHKAEINARPAKEWYMSNREKMKLKIEEAERVKTKEARDLEAEPASSKKRKKGQPETEEEREAKRAKRLKDKIQQRRATEKAERAKDEARIRAGARRARKSMNESKKDGMPFKPKKKGKGKKAKKAAPKGQQKAGGTKTQSKGKQKGGKKHKRR